MLQKLRSFFFALAVLGMLLSSCTVDMSQTQPPAPQVTNELVSTAQVATAIPEPAPTSQSPTINPNMPTTHIPVTWGDLNLTGRLVYLSATQKESNPILSIQILNLQTGEIATLMIAPQLSWIYSLAVSPDGKQLVMTYTTPAGTGTPQYTSLYILPMDGSQLPKLLFTPPSVDDQFIQPEWSPDGKYIYFAHINYKSIPKDQHYPTFEMYRMRFPAGQPEQIAQHAFWPRVADDSNHLVYIGIDPSNGKNQIFLADMDGKNAQPIAMTGDLVPDIIDAPIFSPDRQSLLFSAPIPVKAEAPGWLEKLMGVTRVEAHSVPSEWWQVPLGGGKVVQLTHIQAAGLYASTSPDRKHLAIYSASGLFVMNPDASGLTVLINDLGGIYGTVDWLP
jgi:Tol biopolymer transport system component